MIVTVVYLGNQDAYFGHQYFLVGETSDGLGDNFPKLFVCKDTMTGMLHNFMAQDIELLAVESEVTTH